MILQLIVPKFRWQSLKSDFKLKRFGDFAADYSEILMQKFEFSSKLERCGDFAMNCSEITKAKFEFRLQIGKIF